MGGNRWWKVTLVAVVGTAGLSAYVGAPSAGADHPEAVPRCATRQLTGADPRDGTLALDHDGSHAALLSFAYHADNANEEVVVMDTATNARTRITTTEPASDRDNSSPSISADGSLVVFSSGYDLTGSRESGEITDQVFLYDVEAETLEQLTFYDDTPPGFSFARNAQISADGSTIVFAGERGAFMGIYRYTVATGAIDSLVEDWPVVVGELDVDQDGSHVVFRSDADLVGENPDLGNEAFVADAGGVVQLTDSPEADFGIGAGYVSIDGDGSHVAYRDHLGAVYLHEVATDQRVKIGGNPQGGFFDYVYSPDVASSGERVAFNSGRNLTGQNADGGWEVFVWDTGTNHQVTSSSNPLVTNDYDPAISGDGQRVLFESQANLTGQNSAGNLELFLACTGGPPPRCDGQNVTVDLRLGQTPTAGNDVILGTTAANVINAGGGNDRICAGGGNDTVNGGSGNDRVLAGTGNDTVRGGGGTDRLLGEAGNDSLFGDAGTDTLDGGIGADRLNGGTQRDTCSGGPQTDTATACEVRRGIP